MAIEKITTLPEPLTEMECLLYYIATGNVPVCMSSCSAPLRSPALII